MRCIICKKGADEVEIYEGILEGGMALVCNDCAEREDIPLIRKPSQEQLTKANERHSVRERMERISGFREATDISPDQSMVQRNMARLRVPDKKQAHENVFDNYYWEINMARRRKKFTISQVAEKIGVDAKTLQAIEKGKIPENFEEIFLKLESFFGIKLIKNHQLTVNFKRATPGQEREILEEVKRKMNEKALGLSDESTPKGRTEKLERIHHTELDFSRREDLQNVTLNDLVEIKRAREKREAKLRSKEKIESLVGDDLNIDFDLEDI